MKHRIHLQYTIAEGDLEPYFDALKRSEALASECQACRRVAFPARMICGACGSDLVHWATLSGRAYLICRTDGTTRGFALVRFEGADTLSTVALLDPTTQGTTGRLRSPEDGRSGLWIELDKTTDGDERV